MCFGGCSANKKQSARVQFRTSATTLTGIRRAAIAALKSKFPDFTRDRSGKDFAVTLMPYFMDETQFPYKVHYNDGLYYVMCDEHGYKYAQVFPDNLNTVLNSITL